MSTDVVTTQAAEPPALRIANTIAEIKTNVQMVQHVMRELMVADVHYGRIPGTDKPSLLQPGAELICLTFQWAARYSQDDLSYSDCVRYRSTCELYSRQTGLFVGSGQGEASSDEEKYRWRRAVSKAEWDAAPEDRRRVKIAKGKGGSTYEINQVRIEPADIANTVLKMANKRALIAAARQASACSDMFAQDLEDMSDGTREAVTGGAQPEPPKPLGDDGWKTLLEQAAGFGYTEAEVVTGAAVMGHEGPGPQMPRDLAKQLYRSMRDAAKTTEEEPASPPEPPAHAPEPSEPTGEPQQTLTPQEARDERAEQAAKSPSQMAADLLEQATAKEAAKTVSRKDAAMLCTQCTIHGVTEEELAEAMGADSVEAILASQRDDALAWLKARPVNQGPAS